MPDDVDLSLPPTLPVQPWYTSTVFKLAVVDAVSTWALVFNIHVNTDLLNHVITASIALIACLSPIWVAIKRWRSKAQPLAISQRNSDEKNTASPPIVAAPPR